VSERLSRGTLVGVGVGPGDPDLVTVRAATLLAKADVVFVPVADTGETGRAERTALFYAEAWRIERLPFALTRLEAGGDRQHDLGDREQAWDAAAAQVARWFAEHPGGTAVFATIGDPCIYATFSYLAAGVRELVADLEIQFVPGITAMQDLAARSGTPLVEGREALALFPMTAGTDRFREALSRGDAVVAYKFGRMLPQALDELRRAGRLADAMYGAGLGLPEEDIRPAAELDPDHAGPYLSTLIVPPARTGRGGAL
jgi:precorrin-2/cobalt-factor-2 C20-methyltransferase